MELVGLAERQRVAFGGLGLDDADLAVGDEQVRQPVVVVVDVQRPEAGERERDRAEADARLRSSNSPWPSLT